MTASTFFFTNFSINKKWNFPISRLHLVANQTFQLLNRLYDNQLFCMSNTTMTNQCSCMIIYDVSIISSYWVMCRTIIITRKERTMSVIQYYEESWMNSWFTVKCCIAINGIFSIEDYQQKEDYQYLFSALDEARCWRHWNSFFIYLFIF